MSQKTTFFRPGKLTGFHVILPGPLHSSSFSAIIPRIPPEEGQFGMATDDFKLLQKVQDMLVYGYPLLNQFPKSAR